MVLNVVGSNPSLSAKKWLAGNCEPLFIYSSPKVPKKFSAQRKIPVVLLFQARAVDKAIH